MKQLIFSLVSAAFLTPSALATAPQCFGVHRPALTPQAIQKLMEKSITSPTAKAEAQKALGLDDMNYIYYISLFQKNKQTQKNDPIRLFPGKDGRLVGYPVGASTTPKEINSQFTYVNYKQIQNEFSGETAKDTVVILKKLQAGTGSSMSRTQYFQRRAEMPQLLGMKPGSEMVMGAKGTDLLVKIDHPLNPGQKVEIPIVELQLLQALKTVRSGAYSKMILQDIVGPETRNRLSQVWQKKSLIDPNLTYAQVFEREIGAARASSIFQSHVPALTEAGEISFNRVAPAGHGLFAVDALRAAIKPELLPEAAKRSGKNKILTAIANGEDVNSLPDPVIVEWTIKNQIPIVLVTTTKSSIDKKGGILLYVKDTQTGEGYLKVMDTAEAKDSGQLETFENSQGFASTNLTLFNYEVLTQKLKNFSEQELLQAMAPDLVPNWKEQKDKDGVVRKYLQLEGTMGTVIMNLDRYYRKKHGEALVSIVNIETSKRTDFFAPIKSAFDYFLQFHSDRFDIDPSTYKLRNLGGELPSFTLKDTLTKDAYYSDVQNVLDSFQNTSVRKLQDLQINGQVLLGGMVLEGKVMITNETNQRIDLRQIANRLPKTKDGRPLLRNVEIRWTAEAVSIKPSEATR